MRRQCACMRETLHLICQTLFTRQAQIRLTLYSRVFLEPNVIDLHFHVNITRNWMLSFSLACSLLFPPVVYKILETMINYMSSVVYKHFGRGFAEMEGAYSFCNPFQTRTAIEYWITMLAKDEGKILASQATCI